MLVFSLQGDTRGYSSMERRKNPSVNSTDAEVEPLKANNNDKKNGEEKAIKLERTLGLPSGIGIILGTIIGSGIFVSPKGVLEESGSVGLSLIIWIVAGLICLLGALCFAELGTIITKSGGQYSYIEEAFGSFLGFLYLWSCLLVIFPAANAVIALTFAQNLLQPFFQDCKAPYSAELLLAAAAIG